MSYFKFDYKKEEELSTSNKNTVLTEGEAIFYIDKVHTTNPKTGVLLRTKDGNAKISLQLRVVDSRGKEGVVFQDLTTSMAWMVKALSDSIGIPELYNAEGLNLNRIISKQGRCMIKTKCHPDYPDKTVIAKFLCKTSPVSTGMPSPITHDKDDDLPF